MTKTGADVTRDGLTIEAPKRGAAIWFYRRIYPAAM
jgi:hypothetical protein